VGVAALGGVNDTPIIDVGDFLKVLLARFAKAEITKGNAGIIN